MTLANLRALVLERDGHRCIVCHRADGKLDTHHLRPRQGGDTDVITNMVTVCPACHRRAEVSGLPDNAYPDGVTRHTVTRETVKTIWVTLDTRDLETLEALAARNRSSLAAAVRFVISEWRRLRGNGHEAQQ
jgi:hypothetical protein